MATKKQNRENYLKNRVDKLAKQKQDREAVKQLFADNEKLKQQLARLQQNTNDNVIGNVDTQEKDHNNLDNNSIPCDNDNKQTTNDPNMVKANNVNNNDNNDNNNNKLSNEQLANLTTLDDQEQEVKLQLQKQQQQVNINADKLKQLQEQQQQVNATSDSINDPRIQEQIKQEAYDNTTTFNEDKDGQVQTSNSVKSANKTELKTVKVIQTKDDNNKSVPIQFVDVEAHYKIIKEDYLQRNGEFQDFDDSMLDDIPIIIQGEAGVGKTLSLKAYCMVRGYPLLQLRCSEATKENKLIGTYQLVNGNSIYCLGILTQAIEIANKSKTKTCVIQLDEINTITNAVQKELNEAVNVREGIYIPALNKTYKLKDDCKILICGTMNPSHYSGTNELNPEIPSRFDILVWDDLTELQTKTLLGGFKIDDDLMAKLVTLKTQINASYESENLPYTFDTREIVKFCKRFTRYSSSEYRQEKDGKKLKLTKDQAIEKALVKVCLGKFKAQGKEYSKNIIENIESVFGIEIEDGQK